LKWALFRAANPPHGGASASVDTTERTTRPPAACLAWCACEQGARASTGCAALRTPTFDGKLRTRASAPSREFRQQTSWLSAQEGTENLSIHVHMRMYIHIQDGSFTTFVAEPDRLGQGGQLTFRYPFFLSENTDEFHNSLQQLATSPPSRAEDDDLTRDRQSQRRDEHGDAAGQQG